MIILKKATLCYVPGEDRVCMTAESDGSKQVLFWLTQRMSRRLVPVLCKHLERKTPKRSVISRDMQLSVFQREAEWQYESIEPVTTHEPPAMYLPGSIDYAFSGEITGLTFPVGNDEKAEFRMTLQELRQFLAIVYKLFVHAGWSTDVWPTWFTGGDQRKN